MRMRHDETKNKEVDVVFNRCKQCCVCGAAESIPSYMDTSVLFVHTSDNGERRKRALCVRDCLLMFASF